MPESFLSVLKRNDADGAQPSARFGGSLGGDGRGAPGDGSGTFMFATGIECSYPTIDNGRTRRDLLAECGHYERWREDLQLVGELGLKFLRYGLPYHRIHRGPDRYDWAFADDAMAEIQRLGLMPILDLLHFGVPDWLGDFQNPDLPLHFAAYAGAVAARYPWVRFWTPVNEIYVASRVSAKDGIWNEQRRDDRSFVTALKHLVAANLLAAQAIASQRPDAVFVQSESAEYNHELRAVPTQENERANSLRFLSLDLLYSHAPDASIGHFLEDNGLTRGEYDWFMGFKPPGYQIMGLDYYGRNERIWKPDGTICQAEDVLGWYQIASEYFRRYRVPLMHTETNVFDPDQAGTWLWKQWLNVLRLRRDGVPVMGFTWYSLIDQIDWDIELARMMGTVNACGLFDLDRNPRPVALEYGKLLAEFGQIGLVPHTDLFRLTEGAASLKVYV